MLEDLTFDKDTMASQQTFRRNLLSSLETSAESHSHPFQLVDCVVDVTESVFPAIV